MDRRLRADAADRAETVTKPHARESVAPQAAQNQLGMDGPATTSGLRLARKGNRKTFSLIKGPFI
jgi:hypothetical protein